MPRRSTTLFRMTHFLGYFISLLLSNIVQSVGTVLNARWIDQWGVSAGRFCTIQGISESLIHTKLLSDIPFFLLAALKQAGNLGNAIW